MYFPLKYSSKLFLIALLFVCSMHLSAQHKKSGEIGISAGGSYYLGDINKIPFVGTKISAGAFYRHTFNTRYAVKGVFNYGSLAAEDSKSSNDFQIARNKSFNNTFYELATLAEYNFIPFLPASKKHIYTPYVFAGLSVMYYPGGESTKIIVSVPFGVGFKYNINTELVFEAYIGMRKTYTDNIDFNYNPPTTNRAFKQYGYAGNKDWYSVFGVSLSYKIKYRMKCPAFD